MSRGSRDSSSRHHLESQIGAHCLLKRNTMTTNERAHFALFGIKSRALFQGSSDSNFVGLRELEDVL